VTSVATTLPAGTGIIPPKSARRSRRNFGRFRTPGIYLLLVLLPFITAPGKIIDDTKLNLAINPAGFLARALTLWDPQMFGELQNQAVGYLFPMGPFFALGKLVGLPAWVTQRLWIAVLLVAAYAGVVRLAARLGIGTDATRAAAGLAYALSPLALAMTGELSAEFLPMAMVPWIVLPLASAVRGRTSPARAAARSAVAVALCSGMNAASTVAALAVAIVYLFMASRAPQSPSRRKLLAWWIPASLLATSWWSVPLVLLSNYGVSPVPYTESAATTTSATSLSDVLRGTSDWLSYLTINGQPWWPVGFRIATEALPVLLTGIIAALGLAGLIVRAAQSQGGRIAERRFLLCSVLVGVAIIAAGYVSSLGNPLAGPLDNLINGAASPFRNLWKFDPMVRLPLALGLAHVLAARPAVARTAAAQLTAARMMLARSGTVWVAVAGLALPAYLSGLAAPGSFSEIPDYWVQAANWLNVHAGHQDVLVEPGAQFGQYQWGSPLDEVLSPLTSADYAERDLADIGSPANERLLAAIDQQMAAGDGSAGLSDALARMGVRYLVIRNDLNRNILSGAWPARIHQALSESPGITRAAAFGTFTGTFVPDDAATNFDSPYPPVEIFSVAGALPAATVQAAAGTLRVYGGPESLLTLAGDGLQSGRPVLINDDGAGQHSDGSVVTDSLRRRVRNFGELRTSYSPTMTATQPANTFEATDDYTQPGWNRYQSVAHYIGISDVTASSSTSDVSAIPAQWSSGGQPYAAVDSSAQTYWESGSWSGSVGQWIQETFDSEVNPNVISVAFNTNPALGPAVTAVRISTAAGQVTDPVTITSRPQLMRVPVGYSSWLRITVTGLASRPTPPIGAQVGIYAIYVPGVQAARTIATPAVSGTDPSAVILAKDEPQPSGCMLTSLRWVCSPELATATEEQYGFDRTVAEPNAEPANITGSAILVNTSLATKYARLSPRQPQVTASSTYTSDPQDQALNAFDGDPKTAWVASPSDSHPALHIAWSGARTVSRVVVHRPPGTSIALQAMITGSGGQVRWAWIDADGMVTFPPMRTTSLTITFTPSYAPVQITDVDVPGVLHFSTPAGAFSLPCGLGPNISLNGRVVPTKVTGSFSSLLTERPVRFTACSTVTLAGGSNRIVEPVTDDFSIQDMMINGAGSLGTQALPHAAAPAAANIVSWTATARTLRVSASARSYLVVNENFNDGWQAEAGGRALQPVRLDGWKQAWVLPAGTSGVVHLTFRPERTFRVAVSGGLAAAALIVLAAFWPSAWLPRRRRGLDRVRLLGRSVTASWPVPGSWPGPVPRVPRAFRRSRPARPLRFDRIAAAAWRTGRLVLAAVVLVLLCGLGLWLGGYPGVVILPVVTAAWLLLAGSRWTGPWVVAGLVLAAAICDAVGRHLQASGGTGLPIAVLLNGIPQVLLLVVAGRLAAALIRD
jgi:arabinofuranan 3-O-arabinosyltransferase